MKNKLFDFFLKNQNFGINMDIIELFCREIKNACDKASIIDKQKFIDAINDVNQALKEHKVNYKFDMAKNELVKIK